MSFTLSGILAVLANALPPFLPLILAMVALLITVQLIGHLRGYRLVNHHCQLTAIVSLLVGISTLWWLPWLTHSRLAFVATLTDWAALIVAALGVAIVTWLVLHPLSYLVRGQLR
ncbi:hypothetical protein [Halomonas faecis]|uniref:hypothetical protein n=1 Tax=Halomonas faecis TaxID=1562110 RepID=UPI0013D584DF|nr:hypothetical protein [Halomonas faecis]